MPVMLPDFLSEQDGQIEFVGTRLTVADVMALYQRGYGAEMIALEFPSLSLPVIHRFIAFYLENSGEVDRWLAAHQATMEALRAHSPNSLSLSDLRRRLAARSQIASV